MIDACALDAERLRQFSTPRAETREQGKQVTTKATTTVKRQTQRGVAKAATARKQTETSAAKVRSINSARKAAQATVEQAITDVLKGASVESVTPAVDAAVKSVSKSTRARKGRPPSTTQAELETLRPQEAAAIKALAAKGELQLPYICPRAGCDFAASKSTDRCPTHSVRVVRDRRSDEDRARQQAEIAAAKKAPAKKAAAKKATAAEYVPTKQTQDETGSADELRSTLRGSAIERADKITVAAKKLQAAEKLLKEKGIDARNPATADSTAAHIARDAALQELIKLDAGWTYIARVRGVASSTNRGLCRVIMGGKRI
jgi:colicin import membrane protein